MPWGFRSLIVNPRSNKDNLIENREKLVIIFDFEALLSFAECACLCLAEGAHAPCGRRSCLRRRGRLSRGRIESSSGSTHRFLERAVREAKAQKHPSNDCLT
jgi:hypothetical protein